MPIDPQKWAIYSISYSPPPLVEFSLNFLGRDWFGSGLRGEEALTFARLMLTIYGAQCQGLLISKKDAMRAIRAEHVSTTKRYADIASHLGILEIKRSTIDRRVELLVPTAVGVRAIERELAEIEKTIRWAAGELKSKWTDSVDASDLKKSITVHPLRLEELTLVADPFEPRRERSGPELGKGISKDVIARLEQAGKARPRTHARWIAAYSETIQFMPKNVAALDARCEAYRFLGDWSKALADVNRMVALEPGAWLIRRAYIYNRLGKYDDAISDVTRAIELEPDLKEPRINRAEAYVAKKEWRLALKDLDYVMLAEKREYPSDWVRLRGQARAALGRIKEAIKDFEYVLDQRGQYLGLLTDPDYHRTFSTGEDYRREDEEITRADIAQLEAVIADLKKLLKSSKRK